jgi:hypothetical protein
MRQDGFRRNAQCPPCIRGKTTDGVGHGRRFRERGDMKIGYLDPTLRSLASRERSSLPCVIEGHGAIPGESGRTGLGDEPPGLERASSAEVASWNLPEVGSCRRRAALSDGELSANEQSLDAVVGAGRDLIRHAFKVTFRLGFGPEGNLGPRDLLGHLEALPPRRDKLDLQTRFAGLGHPTEERQSNNHGSRRGCELHAS